MLLNPATIGPPNMIIPSTAGCEYASLNISSRYSACKNKQTNKQESVMGLYPNPSYQLS